jgi:DNA adenine methylase
LARKRPCKKAELVVVSPASVQRQPIDLMKPFLKWVGGKTQIIEDVLALFPNEMENYHEPFLGGGSVLIALLSHKAKGTIKVKGSIYASDLNSNLIGLYKNIQADPSGLIQQVKVLTDEFGKCKKKEAKATANRKPTTLEEAMSSHESYYYWIRSKFNAMSKEERCSLTGSAMLLFLNKTCFRGVYREGPKGFNVPYGNYKNPTILDEEHIRSISALIKDVVFTHCSFTTALTKPESGDFVYLDPPYAPETSTSFVSYTTDKFTLENHKALFKTCTEFKEKHIKMLLSNADVKLVKDAFPAPHYTTKIINCRRAIHSKDPDARTNEVLITN